MTLYNALPVPRPDISLQEILEFKVRRSSELAGLRAELDNLYLAIANSAGVPRAKTAALARLEEALVALDKATRESWSQRLSGTIKVDISIPSVATAAVMGSVLASSFALPVAIGAGLGAAGAAVKFEFKRDAAISKLSAGVSGLAYAIHVKRELAKINN